MTQSTTKYAFIGAGNMSGAILAGMINNGVAPENVIATNRSAEKQTALHQQYGIVTSLSNLDAIAAADVIILGVKPQMMGDVLDELLAQGADFSNKLVITVAAGLNAEFYQGKLGQVRFIRVMPNTPSMLGLGMAGMFQANNDTQYSAEQLQQDRDVCEFMFNSVGKSIWLTHESQIDDIAAVSGSGPAYFFLFIEAMMDKAKQLGFSDSDAATMVKQTAFGAAKMAFDENADPVQLRKNVTSPGGTTHAAITVFEEQNLRGTVNDALDSAIARAKELSNLA